MQTDDVSENKNENESPPEGNFSFSLGPPIWFLTTSFSDLGFTMPRPRPDHIQAAGEGDIEKVMQFVAEGGDPSLSDLDGFTMLMNASENNQVEIVNFLLEQFASKGNLSVAVNWCNDEGLTALHFAAWKGNAAIVRRLIETGAKVDVVDPEMSVTPLHLAAIDNHLEVADILLRAGANLTLRMTVRMTENCIFATAEDLAIRFNHRGMVQKLRSFAAAPAQNSPRARFSQFQPQPASPPVSPSVSPSHQSLQNGM